MKIGKFSAQSFFSIFPLTSSYRREGLLQCRQCVACGAEWKTGIFREESQTTFKMVIGMTCGADGTIGFLAVYDIFE